MFMFYVTSNIKNSKCWADAYSVLFVLTRQSSKTVIAFGSKPDLFCFCNIWGFPALRLRLKTSAKQITSCISQICYIFEKVTLFAFILFQQNDKR